MKKHRYKIDGMDCSSCATLIQMDVEDLGYSCSCSYNSQILEINGDHDSKKVMDIVKKAGYTVNKI